MYHVTYIMNIKKVVNTQLCLKLQLGNKPCFNNNCGTVMLFEKEEVGGGIWSWICKGRRLKLGPQNKLLRWKDSSGNLPFSPSSTPGVPSRYEVVKG